MFNMALDAAVVEAVVRGDAPPTVRLYEWDAAAITIGWNQREEETVDLDRCSADGLDVVRRPTGGRAVYHLHELSYSVAAAVTDPVFGGSLMETYGAIGHVLCEALRGYGVNAVLSPGGSDPGRLRGKGRTRPCFLSASRFEVTVDGKKLVGSAQRRFRGFFLQQGSILLAPGYEKIADYLKVEHGTDDYRRLLSERTVNLSALLDGGFSVGGLKASLKSAFRKRLNTEFEETGPTDGELEAAEEKMERRLAKEYGGARHEG